MKMYKKVFIKVTGKATSLTLGGISLPVDAYLATEMEVRNLLLEGAKVELLQADMKTVDSEITLSNVDAKFGAVTPSYTYDVSPIYGVVAGVPQVKYWSATADVTVAKNVSLHGEYAFNVKAFDVNGNRFDADIDDLATVSLNYVF